MSRSVSPCQRSWRSPGAKPTKSGVMPSGKWRPSLVRRSQSWRLKRWLPASASRLCTTQGPAMARASAATAVSAGPVPVPSGQNSSTTTSPIPKGSAAEPKVARPSSML